MRRLDRYIERAVTLALFPWLVGMHVVGVVVHDALELVEELRAP